MSDILASGADYLAHHGVLGMKWGVRKARPRTFSSDYAKARKLRQRVKKNSITSLSNKELEALNRRKQLENSYNQLNPNIIKTGQKYLKEVQSINKSVTAAVALGASVVAFASTPLGQKLIKQGREAINIFLVKHL